MKLLFLSLICWATSLVSGVAAGQDAPLDRAEHRSQRRTPVVDVFERSRDAVVNISTEEIISVRQGGRMNRFFEDMFDMPRRTPTREYTRMSVGSGFVIHEEGYIVTNAHVVNNSTARRVHFSDGREYDAQIVALDPAVDIAILKIDVDETIHTIPLGRSDDLMIGETVVAIGNPLGFGHTVTAGVVSAVDRDIELSRDMRLTDLIQTDASINPGNSGGPLLNIFGELIGINTAIRDDAQNIGFAISVDRLRRLLPDLVDVERRYRILAGLRVDSVDAPRVLEVAEGSPAAKAGVLPGDLLTSVNGAPVRFGGDYDLGLIGGRPGTEVVLGLERRGESLTRAFRLEQRPVPDARALAESKLGVRIEPISTERARQLRLPARVLRITEIARGGPADRIGIEPGDLILGLGRHAVTSTEDLGDLLEVADAGDEVDVTVMRVESRRKYKLTGRIRIAVDGAGS